MTIYGRKWSDFVRKPSITVFSGPTTSYTSNLSLEEWGKVLNLREIKDNIEMLQQILFFGGPEQPSMGGYAIKPSHERKVFEAILNALGTLGV